MTPYSKNTALLVFMQDIDKDKNMKLRTFETFYYQLKGVWVWLVCTEVIRVPMDSCQP